MKIICILTLGLCANAFAATEFFRLSWRDNPATTMVIGWHQNGGTSPTVHYGPADFGTDYTAYPSTATPAAENTARGLNNRFVRLTNLSPNTNYYFVVRDSSGVSPRMWFKTAPNQPMAFTYISGGDSRNNRMPRQQANRMVSKLRPLFVAFGGDYTDSSTDLQWREWMEDWQQTKSADGRMYPIVATRGNHDDNATVAALFDVPNTNVYYALPIGGTFFRIYTLNTEITAAGTQGSWLKGDLQNNAEVFWKFAQYHRPMFPHVAAKAEQVDLYTAWAQLFYDYAVNLVEESDAHCVKRTWPLKPTGETGSQHGFIRSDVRGTIYLGEGCWGAPLRSADDAKTWTRNMDHFNHLNWNHVYFDKLETRSIMVANVDSVASVSDAQPFTAPANLSVWNPSNGSVVRAVPFPPGEEIIVDNRSTTEVTIQGDWSSTTTAGCWDLNALHDGESGKGTKYVRFTPPVPATGMYQVFGRWSAHANRATNTPIDITWSGGTTTVIVNQRTEGGIWRFLGNFHFAAGSSGNVTVRTTGTDGYVIADAVRLVRVPAASDLVIDNADPTGIVRTGSWSSSNGLAGYYGSNYLHDGNSNKGNSSVRYTPVVATTGTYRIYARWTADSARAAKVPIDIIHADGTTTVEVNQQINGGIWFSLGVYNLNAGSSAYFVIRNTETSGIVIADAFKISKQ